MKNRLCINLIEFNFAHKILRLKLSDSYRHPDYTRSELFIVL